MSFTPSIQSTGISERRSLITRALWLTICVKDFFLFGSFVRSGDLRVHISSLLFLLSSTRMCCRATAVVVWLGDLVGPASSSSSSHVNLYDVFLSFSVFVYVLSLLKKKRVVCMCVRVLYTRLRDKSNRIKLFRNFVRFIVITRH